MKPGDFLLGVLDVFAILLPGGLATWLAVQYIPAAALRSALSFGAGDSAATIDGLVLGVAFLVASYALGHFVFMTGAQLDESYDRWRKRTYPPERDTTHKAAEKLYESLNRELNPHHFSTLKWAKAYIQVTSPQSRVEIDRLEADQKFFRSLVVIGFAYAAHFVLREFAPTAALAALLMAVLSYQRYRNQRWKMTELIYGTVVVLHAALMAAPRPGGSSPGGA